MIIRIILAGLIFGSAMCFPQTAAPPADLKSCPASGKITANLEPVADPLDLDQLVRMSQLIVDGTVIAVLPAVNRNPDREGAIQTDSLVAVQPSLYGALPAGTGTIVIAQEGGKTTQCEEVIPEDPLLKVGERYIFFLTPDNRKAPSNTTGFPRYDVVGIWGGKVKVSNDVIQFSSSATSGLHLMDKTKVDTFLSQVKERVSRLLLFEHP